MLKEACTGSFKEAKNAEMAGADRIELCENLFEGGTTPSYGTVKKALEKIGIPVFPMIRPRGGNFCYSASEVEIMIEDIRLFKRLGVQGVVLGVLTEDNEIDYPLLRRLLKESSGMEVTFHKAIDEVKNPLEEIEKLIDLGVARILTSGKSDTALEGEILLNELIKAAEGRMKIVVAGKVTRDNLQTVKSKIPAYEFHGKKIVGDLGCL